MCGLLLGYDHILLRCNYLKIWNLRVLKTSKYWVNRQMKFFAMPITNKKISLDIFMEGNVSNIFMVHELYLMVFGIKEHFCATWDFKTGFVVQSHNHTVCCMNILDVCLIHTNSQFWKFTYKVEKRELIIVIFFKPYLYHYIKIWFNFLDVTPWHFSTWTNLYM